MSIQSKKMAIADKMYHQNSKGGKGAASKYKQVSKSEGKLSMKYTESGKGTGKGGGQPYSQSDAKGSFIGKYNQ